MDTEFKFKVGDRIHFSYMYDYNYDSLEVISVSKGVYMDQYMVCDKDGKKNIYSRNYIEPCYEIDKVYQRRKKLEKLLG